MGLSWTQLAIAGSTAWVFKFLLQKYSLARSKKHILDGCPGGSLLWLHPFRSAAIVLGPVFPFVGWMGYYYAKFSLFAKYGSTCLSSITFWDAIPIFWLSDADAIKTISSNRVLFPKDVEAYETLNIYGKNMVGSEGSDWKRHRSVANSAFNEANNALVWRETIRIVNEWFEEIDAAQEKHDDRSCSIDLLKDLTQVTLLVISAAGFGRRVSLKEDSNLEPPPGHTMAFRPAVTSTLSHLFTKVLTPNWIYDLSDQIYLPLATPALNETRECFDALRLHMLEVISLARSWIAGGKSTFMEAALLRNLVEANMIHDGDSNKHLSDDELLSNTFTFLLAGHETSAHSLCFAVMLLALYPDVQQRIYEEALGLWPDSLPSPGAPSAYKESMAILEYTTAAFYETLRLFPAVARLAKHVLSDTSLKSRRFSSTPDGKVRDVKVFDVPIKAGSIVIIDIFGLHMNPIHWGDDVADFKPERFIDTSSYRWPRDAFNAFASGPRSCIGQRFSVTESVCILAHLTRQYEILVPEALKYKSPAEQRKIMLQWTPGITIIPNNAHVHLRRRM